LNYYTIQNLLHFPEKLVLWRQKTLSSATYETSWICKTINSIIKKTWQNDICILSWRRTLTNLEDIIICLCFEKLPWFIFGLILILPSELDLWNWIRPWRLNKFGVLGIVDQPCIIKKHTSFKPLWHNHRSRVASAHAHSCWSLRVAHETSSHFPVTAFQAHHRLLQHRYEEQNLWKFWRQQKM